MQGRRADEEENGLVAVENISFDCRPVESDEGEDVVDQLRINRLGELPTLSDRFEVLVEKGLVMAETLLLPSTSDSYTRGLSSTVM